MPIVVMIVMAAAMRSTSRITNSPGRGRPANCDGEGDGRSGVRAGPPVLATVVIVT